MKKRKLVRFSDITSKKTGDTFTDLKDDIQRQVTVPTKKPPIVWKLVLPFIKPHEFIDFRQVDKDTFQSTLVAKTGTFETIHLTWHSQSILLHTVRPPKAKTKQGVKIEQEWRARLKSALQAAEERTGVKLTDAIRALAPPIHQRIGWSPDYPITELLATVAVANLAAQNSDAKETLPFHVIQPRITGQTRHLTISALPRIVSDLGGIVLLALARDSLQSLDLSLDDPFDTSDDINRLLNRSDGTNGLLNLWPMYIQIFDFPRLVRLTLGQFGHTWVLSRMNTIKSPWETLVELDLSSVWLDPTMLPFLFEEDQKRLPAPALQVLKLGTCRPLVRTPAFWQRLAKGAPNLRRLWLNDAFQLISYLRPRDLSLVEAIREWLIHASPILEEFVLRLQPCAGWPTPVLVKDLFEVNLNPVHTVGQVWRKHDLYTKPVEVQQQILHQAELDSQAAHDDMDDAFEFAVRERRRYETEIQATRASLGRLFEALMRCSKLRRLAFWLPTELYTDTEEFVARAYSTLEGVEQLWKQWSTVPNALREWHIRHQEAIYKRMIQSLPNLEVLHIHQAVQEQALCNVLANPEFKNQVHAVTWEGSRPIIVFDMESKEEPVTDWKVVAEVVKRCTFYHRASLDLVDVVERKLSLPRLQWLRLEVAAMASSRDAAGERGPNQFKRWEIFFKHRLPEMTQLHGVILAFDADSLSISGNDVLTALTSCPLLRFIRLRLKSAYDTAVFRRLVSTCRNLEALQLSVEIFANLLPLNAVDIDYALDECTQLRLLDFAEIDQDAIPLSIRTSETVNRPKWTVAGRRIRFTCRPSEPKAKPVLYDSSETTIHMPGVVGEEYPLLDPLGNKFFSI